MVSNTKTMVVRLILGVGLLMVAISLQGCGTKFEMNVSYTCTNQANNVCLGWSQTGAVEQPANGCFPGDAVVRTSTGIKQMADLQIGDEIYAFDEADGQPKYSPVRAWLHRDANAEMPMTAIKTDVGDVVTTAGHSLATPEGYEFAASIVAGDTLTSADGVATVQSKEPRQSKGIYAPLTMTSNFFVGVPGQEPLILAHSFAHVQNPQRYDWVFHSMLTAMEYVDPSINNIPWLETTATYMHPLARFFLPLAKMMGPYQSVNEDAGASK